MSTPVNEEFVNIEINGTPLKARKGEMIIRATDEHGAYVPRFCYHEKLSIAANCRMCLVEVEKAPKPLPACATPVAEGMKIFTRSARAIGAQRATMEFLLINHPLDCPICDQGGECELQDLAVGFGRDIARFTERKRVVPDENLGPLIATDMTRCIHCTRCVRFTQEIAGFQELGMIGRGEQMKVRVAIEQTVDHELSGNVIDLCPVGALVSKPYRFKSRGWEMTSHAVVSPHDGVGTNLFAHVLRGKVMRVVPRENETINETWIADRDRFSYESLYGPERLTAPQLKVAGEWRTVDWAEALDAVAQQLKSHSSNLAVLANSSSSCEELYLLNKVVRSLGCSNIDHRLRQMDVRDQSADSLHPQLGMPIAEVDRLSNLLLIGANLRREVPILAHRVRKAVLAGANVHYLHHTEVPYLFPVVTPLISKPAQWVADLTGILAALVLGGDQPLPANLAATVRTAEIRDHHRVLAAQMRAGGERSAIWLGAMAVRHAAFSELRVLAAAIAKICGARLGVLAEGANAAGAYLAGAVPHREAGGLAVLQPGKSAAVMLAEPQQAYLLWGGVEPWLEAADDTAVLRNLRAAKTVIAVTPFACPALRETAQILLPMAAFTETSGTYVNLEGRWQSFAGATAPAGQARPGWKILRVLGNLLELADCVYQSSEEVLQELRQRCESSTQKGYSSQHPLAAQVPSAPLLDLNMYQTDSLVRRAPSLQRTREGRLPAMLY
jgi:NADH-quinone oxidoreductase subunit G